MGCYIAGAYYFAVNQQVYALNNIHGLIFPVDDSCAPLGPIVSILAPHDRIQLCGINLHVFDGGVEYWREDSQQWESVKLFSTFGDACGVVVNPPVLRTFNGFILDQDEGDRDEEATFYSYGWPPTWQSINQWVEDRKGCHVPNVCPLKDCKIELRRSHALKDHLLFKFGIKEYKCDHVECGKAFATKTNYDRHIKGCVVWNNCQD
ncbi:unnamed protein product [Rhizoctonia solani]|uniref:C2H2-type domain-containing protein n=1 Tax=Rhizoctonia solani TaxID=456999 RepID=A0A8H3E7Z4_9AGAM|nr:unnamed protein product [Rhizoctonia solani]